MRTLAIFLIIFVFALAAASQAPDTLWTRTYGGTDSDGAQSVRQTTDGGYIIAGNTRSFGIPGGNNMYLLKTNGFGDTVWTRTYGGLYGDECYSVEQTTDGGFILAGSTSSFGAGGSDFYLVKTNSSGDTLWTRTYGGIEHDIAHCVQQTVDGGYVLVGNTRSFGAGYIDFWLVKTDSIGQMVWARIYGGSSNDEAQSVRQTADGGYIIAGWTNSFGVTPDDAYLVKTNSTGDTLWTRTYGGSLDDDVRCVEQTADGGYVAAGANLYILKTTSTGDTLWTRRFGNGVLYSVKQTPDGGYIVAGNTYSLGHADFYLLRTNSIGDALWTRTYGGVEDDMAHSVQKTSDGGYVVAGLTNSFGAGDYDFYIVKMGTDPKIRIQFPNGGEQWQIFQYHTIGWWGYGFDSIHIELNRDYPVGGWETLAAVTENDGVELVYINAPPSDHCRVRISALEDTLSDISDGDFSIVSSQGYLALARQSLPTSPVLTWNAGTVECPSSFTETFRLKNFGSEAIVVFQPLEPASDEFSRATSCGSYFALAPGQMSTCSLTLAFDPDDDGTYLDTLLIQTDAANGVNGYVRIPLSGTQISTPAAPEVVISPEGIHARLSWESVTHAENGCPVTVTAYLVFYAEELDGPYLFHGYTTDTTYVHTGVLHFAAGMYYHVIATTEELPLLQLLPTEGVMTEAEVVKRMRDEG